MAAARSGAGDRGPKTNNRHTQSSSDRRGDSEIDDYFPSSGPSEEDSNDSAEDVSPPSGQDRRQLQVRRRSRQSPIKKTEGSQTQSRNLVLKKKRHDRLRTSQESQRGSLLGDVSNDCWSLFRTSLGVPWLLYPIWKWFLLGYLIWLAGSYLLVSLYSLAVSSLSATLCPIPILGSRIPFCATSIDRSIDLSRITTSQDELTLVMDNVGQNFGLARDMVGHEFAVRDLRIRVGASDLARKQELTRELESLIRNTKQTAKSV